MAALVLRFGDENARKILKCKKVTVQFDAAEEIATITATLPTSKFTVWRTVEIGGVAKAELPALLEREGFFVSPWSKDIIGKPAFTTLAEKKTLELTRCTVRDLGFTREPTTKQIQGRVKELGGILCPAEVGPHLRRQLKDQKNGDIFWLVMEQITDSHGNPNVFLLKRLDVGLQWLLTNYAHPGLQWDLDNEIVFVLATLFISLPPL